MKNLALILAMALCPVVFPLLGRPLRADDAAGQTLKVFILAGQSNMQGHGVVDLDDPRDYNGGKGTLLWSLEHAQTKDRMQHLRNAQQEWVVRDDVFVRYQTEHELKRGGLTIGFSGYGGKHHIGPELQFGHVVGDHFPQPVLLIKTCWGGKSLFKDFRPPSADGETGPYYTQMIAEVRTALAEIQKDFPDLKFQKSELSGFVWMQGWNDMIDEPSRKEYADNLVLLAQDLRAEFQSPELPFLVGELGNGGAAEPDSNMQQFRDAQKNGTSRIKHARFVETRQFARPAELSPNVGHGHHWYGNAESYFLVGDALGRAMIELTAKKPKP